MTDNISPTEAAKLLGISAEGVRVWIQQGCPFGEITRHKAKKGGRNTYYISRSRLEAWQEGKGLNGFDNGGAVWGDSPIADSVDSTVQAVG